MMGAEPNVETTLVLVPRESGVSLYIHVDLIVMIRYKKNIGVGAPMFLRADCVNTLTSTLKCSTERSFCIWRKFWNNLRFRFLTERHVVFVNAAFARFLKLKQISISKFYPLVEFAPNLTVNPVCRK